MSKTVHSSQKWAFTVRIIHWVNVLLLIATWVSVEYMDNTPLHKSLGIIVLLWAVVRIINRVLTKDPAKLPAPKWQKVVAESTHGLLYLALLAMPILGILTSMYGGYPVSVFGIFEIPMMVEPSREMAKLVRGLHKDTMWTTLLVLTAVHIVAAVYHQFVLKDNLINRMK